MNRGSEFFHRAESLLFRRWGAAVIGMTNLPEARLAREAELCYATLALVTDYDTWHEEEESVTAGSVLEVLRRNVALAGRVLFRTVQGREAGRDCACRHALRDTILTYRAAIPAAARQRLGLLLDRYLED